MNLFFFVEAFDNNEGIGCFEDGKVNFEGLRMKCATRQHESLLKGFDRKKAV